MSRIIVKQLPKKIDENELRNIFSATGHITDISMKYTPEGTFRQFCFIGYQAEDEAKKALEFFDKTCIHTRRIRVELCGDLGTENKPRPWSKYTKEKQKLLDLMNEKTVNSKENVNKISKLKEIVEKYKDDAEFKEFLQAHDKHRLLWANDAKIKEDASPSSKSDNEEDVEENADDNNELPEKDDHDIADREERLATKSISDLEYMKSLIDNKNDLNISTTKQSKPNLDLFTIKIHNVPYKTKRQDVLKFFKPLKPYSVRLPTKIHGFCYVGFKTEKDMKRAMLKNKSFIKSKQVFFSDFTEKNKITKNKLNNLESRMTAVPLNAHHSKWKQQADSLCNEEDISESGKIFFRNLTYTVNEDELQKLFEQFGPVAELNLPIDSVTRQIKGFGTVTYLMPEHAIKAFNQLDGSTFHGRLLHLMPGKSKTKEADDENDAGLTFKEKKELKLKKSAQQSVNWNTLFLGSNAVAEILAQKFETTKEQIFDTAEGGSSAAVRLALGETQTVIEMKKFLEDNGVQLNVFDGPVMKRSKTTILVKNLPHDANINDLKLLFGTYGPISRFILPPTGVTAIVEYCDAGEARQAFKKLAYSKFKSVPLYLEWAPENTLSGDNRTSTVDTFTEERNTQDKKNIKQTEQLESQGHQSYEQEGNKEKSEEECEEKDDSCPEPNTTLFLRNINFKTKQETIYNHFKGLGAIHTVEIAKRRDTSNPQDILSLGYGFIQFKKASTADKALKIMQFTTIDGNQVELKRSDRTLKDSEDQVKAQRKKVSLTKQTGTKILVRNIAFQAKMKEVQDIFKAFGELRSVRLPRKMTPGEDTHRGFGFVDFISKSDAKKAFEALSQSTHLYGRRLVLEWASTSDEDVTELRKRAAQESNALDTYKVKRGNRAVFAIDSNSTQQNE
ncbi:putative RNA-binding protein 19 [Glossina fuscipes fuscipes]